MQVDDVDGRDLLVLDPPQLGLEVRDVAVHARALVRDLERDVVLTGLDVHRHPIAHVVDAVPLVEEGAGGVRGRGDQQQRAERREQPRRARAEAPHDSTRKAPRMNGCTRQK
jgi:hypothetical protein